MTLTNKEMTETKIYLYKGDNLKVLDKETIKPNIVYMDPPYNTWNLTLTYSDKTNSEDWKINFLKLIEKIKVNASDNCVYFISIGQEELANVIQVLETKLGKKSIISIMPRRAHNGHKTTKTIALQHDFVVVAKTGLVEFNGVDFDMDSYKHIDSHIKERGKYQLRRIDYKEFKWSESLDYEIKIDGKNFYPGGVSKEEWNKRKDSHNIKDWSWIWSMEKIKFAIENDYVEIVGNNLYKKTYTKAQINRIEKGKYEIELLKRQKKIDSLYFTDKKYALKKSKILTEQLFDYPKSDELLIDLLSLPKFKEKIILDPFAGTGTTAIASKIINAKEVHTIQRSEQIQKNTLAYKKGYKDIYDLTKKNIEERTKLKIKEII